MKHNQYQLFNEVLNQSADSKFRYACSIFASASVLSYNCWIKLTLDDIMKIVVIMVSKWTLNLTAWAKWDDATQEVLQYIKDNAKERNWKVPELKKITDDKIVMDYISNWYEVMTWIMVNKKFVEDVPDWKIDTKNYKDLMGTDLKHYLWMLLSEWDKKEYLCDSYAWNKAWREWLYECKFSEVLKFITQHTKFVFI